MRITVALTLLFGFGYSAQAQDVNTGRSLAATCFACHGPNGISVDSTLPSFAGMNKATLLRQLHDFRDGRRASTVMQQLAKGYTDGQLELIAEYFALQKK